MKKWILMAAIAAAAWWWWKSRQKKGPSRLAGTLRTGGAVQSDS